MPPEVDLKYHKPAPRQVINVGGVTFGGTVRPGWYLAVIKNDSFKSTFRRCHNRNSQQAIDFVTLRDVAYKVLVIIGGAFELLLESNLTA